MKTKTPKKEQPLGNIFFLIFFALSMVNIFFNFMGSPLVKWVYLAQLVFVLLSVFFGKRENHLWVYILFSFFEGQGRVVWGYGIVFRLIFDIMLGLMVLRDLAKTKKIFDREILPNFLIFGIILHFIWWGLELFNPSGPDLFAAFATSKYYIFPFFLFFLLKSMRYDFSSPVTQRKLQDCVIIVYLLSLLVVVQSFFAGELIESVSSNYVSLFPKYAIFTGYLYRPWGTSFLPGGMSAYFYCFIGLWLLYRPQVLYHQKIKKLAITNFVKYSGIFLMLYASFVSQVRSSTIKLVLIIGFYSIFKFLGSKVKAKRAVSAIFTVVLLSLTIPFFTNLNPLMENNSVLDQSLERWDGVLESGVTEHRAGIDVFLRNVEKNVQFPFGFGLGMTQSFLPNYEARRKQHVEVSPYAFWHLDNLIMFLFLELGLGAIFYLFILMAIIVSLFSRLFTLYRWQSMTAFGVVAASCASAFVFIISNWGGVLLPYNPDSFYFWMWVALGFSTFYHAKKSRSED